MTQAFGRSLFTMQSILDKWKFEARGGHGCSNSDYRPRRMTCCGSFAVEDTELCDLYTDPKDLNQSVALWYGPRSENPPTCPFCCAVDWAMVEITNPSDVPEAWRWALRV